MPSHQTGAPKTDLSTELFHSLDPSCPITTIDCSGSLDAPPEEGEIRNLRQVGGYRWLYRRYPQQPEISVPGVPDLWDPPKLPEKIGKVGKDCDLQGHMEVVDANATQLKPHDISPFEPIFHSLTSPSELQGVQVVVNRNLLRRLYRWCGGTDTFDGSGAPQEFRVDCEVIRVSAPTASISNEPGLLVLLHRWERPYLLRARQVRSSTSNQSYKAYALTGTLPHAVRGPSCQRLVTYDYGGMKLLVRFDVDACTELPAAGRDIHGTLLGTPEQTKPKDSRETFIPSDQAVAMAGMGQLDRRNDEAIEEAFYQLRKDRREVARSLAEQDRGRFYKTVQREPTPPPVPLPPSAGGILLQPSNYAEPSLSSLFELKTLSVHRQLNMADIYGQLYYSQTPYVYIARHRNGDYSKGGQAEKIALGGSALITYAIDRQVVRRRVAGILKGMVDFANTRFEGTLGGQEEEQISFVGWHGQLRAYRREESVCSLSDEALAIIQQGMSHEHEDGPTKGQMQETAATAKDATEEDLMAGMFSLEIGKTDKSSTRPDKRAVPLWL